jgi:hypothetical protein
MRQVRHSESVLWRTGSLCSSLLAIASRKSKVENRFARVAKLADAPDLGLKNHRFQNVPFRFKKQSVYEGKTRFFTISVPFTTGE